MKARLKNGKLITGRLAEIFVSRKVAVKIEEAKAIPEKEVVVNESKKAVFEPTVNKVQAVDQKKKRGRKAKK